MCSQFRHCLDVYKRQAIARAMVLGYQGKDLNDQLTRNDEIMACVKHFALYGACLLYTSAMTSFNEIDGVPATANHWLLTDVLRNQWGFNGFVVTDFTGISEMVEHGIGDLQTVSACLLYTSPSTNAPLPR